MQLPRSKKLKEDLYSIGMLYGLVVAMVVLAFLFSGSFSNVVSFQSGNAAFIKTLGPQSEYQVP